MNSTEGFAWGIIRGGMSSVADLFIAQMQDYLGLGTKARVNIPGKPAGNWQWRMLPGAYDDKLAEKIRTLTELFGRCGG